MATMQHKIFCICEFVKTESATAVQRAFRLRFNIQPPTRGAVYCSSHIIFVTSSNFEIQTYEIESIFLNHTVFYTYISVPNFMLLPLLTIRPQLNDISKCHYVVNLNSQTCNLKRRGSYITLCTP